VQVVYEVRTPQASADVDVLAYVDGLPYTPITAFGHQHKPLPGNTTFRFVAVNLPTSGSEAKPLLHSVQLLLTFGPDQIPISDTYVEFVVAPGGSSCPHDCSNAGVCHRGYCVCFDGFLGAACELSGERTAQGKDEEDPFTAYSGHIAGLLEQENAAQAAGSNYLSDASFRLVKETNTLLQQRDHETVHRLTAAAAANKRELQVFMAAWAEQEAEQDQDEEEDFLGLSHTAVDLQQYQQDIADLQEIQVKSIEVQADNFEERKRDHLQSIALKKAQRRAQWDTAKARNSFGLSQVETRNGPRVQIDQLSAAFSSTSGLVSSAVLDPSGNGGILVENSEIELLYSDIPR
jgi:hypothetical protein